ncbi:MAG: hypothetical protein IJ740_08895 [Ruminococcus sp.]|nr:hypothetical protein [Ruminococcus sp.]
MQYAVTIALIIVILLVLGVSTQALASVSAYMIVYFCIGLCIVMTVFFAVFLARLMLCKKTRGVYKGARDAGEGRIKYKRAVYEIEGSEHLNNFPMDIKLFYKENKDCELYMDKKGGVYDINARITIIAGLMMSVAMTFFMVLVAQMILE